MRRKRVDVEACCVCRDVEEFTSRALSGDALQALPLCLKRSGALEARRDVEVWSSSVLFVVVGISIFRSSRLLGQNACGLRTCEPH